MKELYKYDISVTELLILREIKENPVVSNRYIALKYRLSEHGVANKISSFRKKGFVKTEGMIGRSTIKRLLIEL